MQVGIEFNDPLTGFDLGIGYTSEYEGDRKAVLIGFILITFYIIF